MFLRLFTEPLTAKRVMQIAAVVVCASALCFGGLAGWQWWSSRPKSPAQLKELIYAYLKKHSRHSDFSCKFNFGLAEEVAAIKTNNAGAFEELSRLQSTLVSLQLSNKALARALVSLRVEEREARQAFNKIKSAAEQKQGTNEQNAASLQTELEAKRALYHAKEKELNEKETLAKNVRVQLTACRTNLDEKNKLLEPVQTELRAKEQELAAQQNVFATDIRKQIADAVSYESLYLLIGRQLWMADQLLDKKTDAAEQNALALISEAVRHASESAVNPWLAARICEAYLLPRIHTQSAVAIRKAKAVQNSNTLLQTCVQTFRQAGEMPLLIRTYEMVLANAKSDQGLDGTRAYLAEAYAEVGNREQALKYYQQIKDEKMSRYAERRITRLTRQPINPQPQPAAVAPPNPPPPQTTPPTPK